MNLGAMYHLNGKLEKAEQSYQDALKLKPDDVTTQQNLIKLRNLMQNNGRQRQNGKRWGQGYWTRAILGKAKSIIL